MNLSGAAGNGFHYDLKSDKGKKKGLFLLSVYHLAVMSIFQDTALFFEAESRKVNGKDILQVISFDIHLWTGLFLSSI